jgi:sortase A
MISIFAPSVERCRRRDSILLFISWILMIGGVLSLAYVGYVIAEANAYQQNEMLRFESAKIESESEHSQPSLRPQMLGVGDVLGEIQIPRLDLNAVVVEGDSPRILRRAVGHLSGTALPGQSGNVAVAGHRDTFFRRLRLIRPGDIITFKIPGQQFQYAVETTRVVEPNDTSVLEPSRGRQLTLITCFPFSYVGPAPDRFVVVAKQMGQTPQL